MADEHSHATDCFFLSYSRSDERFALRFAKDVRGQGIAIWVDQFDIRPSEHWDRAIERAVRECRGIVVILSPRSVASDNVADEISYAIDSGKSVLPIMIERCTLPLRITRMQVIDATGNYDKALQQSLSELGRQTRSGNVQAAVPPKQSGRLGAEILSDAKQRLAPIVGPIAGIIVDKAATRARSPNELHSMLAQHIEKDADRRRFLDGLADHAAGNSAPPPDGARPEPKISPAELDAISGALVHYLGPIAPLIAKRESREASTIEQLRERLAAMIQKVEDRDEFLRRLEPH